MTVLLRCIYTLDFSLVWHVRDPPRRHITSFAPSAMYRWHLYDKDARNELAERW